MPSLPVGMSLTARGDSKNEFLLSRDFSGGERPICFAEKHSSEFASYHDTKGCF